MRFLLLLILPGVIYANDIVTQTFDAFLADIHQQALMRGVSSKTLNDVLPKLEINTRVLELDKAQPEFTQTFWSYLNQRVHEKRIKKGKTLYQKHKNKLKKIEQQYGVAGQFLIAFWGLETNFGQYIGIFPVVQSLATLAYDLRRRDFFTEQLLVVLELIDQGKISANVKGSWAGAMGWTQFMPSNVKAYALDANQNGKLDLWSDVDDVFSSSANFLKHIGWRQGERWGREVQLPADFDYQKSGLGFKKPLAYWQRLGLKKINGKPLPNADMQASLVLPMGYRGPAFLVYNNFYSILNWNRSILYAISVGYLADRILSLPPLVSQAITEPSLKREQVLWLQNKLNQLGFDVGKADGIIGPKTRAATRQYQIQNQLPVDGYVGYDLFLALKS